MKTTLLTILLALTTMFMVGCESDSSEILIIDEIPQPPQGVTSFTGDGAVIVNWYGPYVEDLAGFVVYRSLDPVDFYESIGTVTAQVNPNLDLIPYSFVDNNVSNGTTYYYAVTSVDDAGQESLELSAEVVGDTPRPEGTVTLYDLVEEPSFSALIFGEPSVPVHYTNVGADLFIDSFEGLLYINAADIDTDIMDMGFTDSLEVVDEAPVTNVGWSTLGYFELLVGHTYVFWTRDNFYAKVRVISLTASSVNLEWAFQTDVGNPELVQSNFEIEKPVHDENYLNKNIILKNQ